MVTNSISAASAFFGTTSVLNEDRMFEGKTLTAFQLHAHTIASNFVSAGVAVCMFLRRCCRPAIVIQVCSC